MEEQFRRNDIILKKEWIEEATQFVRNHPSDSNNTYDRIYEQFLYTDLRTSSPGTITIDVSSTHNQLLPGSHILQINDIFNASAPNESRLEEKSRRLLKFSLTDGKQNLFGFEYKQLPSSSIHINSKPGIKIRVKSPMIRRGLLLLEPQNVEILGGSVQSLIEEWESVRAAQTSKRFSVGAPEENSNSSNTNKSLYPTKSPPPTKPTPTPQSTSIERSELQIPPPIPTNNPSTKIAPSSSFTRGMDSSSEDIREEPQFNHSHIQQRSFQDDATPRKLSEPTIRASIPSDSTVIHLDDEDIDDYLPIDSIDPLANDLPISVKTSYSPIPDEEFKIEKPVSYFEGELIDWDIPEEDNLMSFNIAPIIKSAPPSPLFSYLADQQGNHNKRLVRIKAAVLNVVRAIDCNKEEYNVVVRIDDGTLISEVNISSEILEQWIRMPFIEFQRSFYEDPAGIEQRLNPVVRKLSMLEGLMDLQYSGDPESLPVIVKIIEKYGDIRGFVESVQVRKEHFHVVWMETYFPSKTASFGGVGIHSCLDSGSKRCSNLKMNQKRLELLKLFCDQKGLIEALKQNQSVSRLEIRTRSDFLSNSMNLYWNQWKQTDSFPKLEKDLWVVVEQLYDEFPFHPRIVKGGNSPEDIEGKLDAGFSFMRTESRADFDYFDIHKRICEGRIFS